VPDPSPSAIRFFRTAGALRAWLQRNHATARELWIGMHRKGSGRPSITYPEALDEALCFGWIDGVRKKLDATSYVQRFTPRKPKSYWSLVNIRHAKRLQAEGRMAPAGLAAFAKRDEKQARKYSFEARTGLDAVSLRELRRNKAAWKFFEAQPPGYRRVAGWWVASAKRDETRRRRLAVLISHSAKGERIPPLQ
jgi:uncharacterized protein YdeI (YjbR/CyaY-like superfamily)